MNDPMQFTSTAVKAAAPAAVSAGLKWAAVLCGLGLLVLLYLVTAAVSKYWNPRKLVEGADGRASTSKFQWLLWLVAIFFAYTTLWVLRAAQGDFSALSETPVNLLTILGLSTGTAAAAKGITTAYVQSGRVTKQASSAGGTQPGIFYDDNGVPELAKIQMMGLTIVAIGIFLADVTHQIVSNRVAPSPPDIGATLAVLTGISQAGYLGKKLLTSGPAAVPLSVTPDRPVHVIADRPALVSPRRYSRPRGGGQQVRSRFLAVLVAIVPAAVTTGVLLWFFSNPEGYTRQEATSKLVTFAVQTLALAAITGFAAMATLEMVKRLFHLRGRFFIRDFDRAAGPEFLRSARLVRPGKSGNFDHEAGVRRIDLPLEQLMAQLSYATEEALNQLFPDRIEPHPPVAPGDLALPELPEYKLLLNLVDGASLDRALMTGDPTMLRIETQAALDDLQVRVGNDWRWRLRLASSGLAALFSLVALIYVPVPPASKIAALAGSFLLGGFLAGFFRDLTATVERFRGL